jgi:hypothetical protein
MRPIGVVALWGLCATVVPWAGVAQEVQSYSGSCDASAAISLNSEIFVIGNDEDNILRYYRRGQSSPIGSLALSGFLRTGSDEADIEGAAAIGSRIYWITSHSPNSKGKVQPSRHRFFATEIRGADPPVLEAVGKPYVDLLRDLVDKEELNPFRLDSASRLAAESEGGLNIEGLAATPDGGLLIGFRNPLRDGHALVVPLQNPAELIQGKRAKLGAPMQLDLGRRGIRSIELVGSTYLIVAGPTGDDGSFALYRWSGKAAEAPVPMTNVAFGSLRPEAVAAIPQTPSVQLLSDDGGSREAGIECKKLPMPRQSFRSRTVTP